MKNKEIKTRNSTGLRLVSLRSRRIRFRGDVGGDGGGVTQRTTAGETYLKYLAKGKHVSRMNKNETKNQPRAGPALDLQSAARRV